MPLPEKYVVTKNQIGWSVWDRQEGMALATFSSMQDADTCRDACELVRRACANAMPSSPQAAHAARGELSTGPSTRLRR